MAALCVLGMAVMGIASVAWLGWSRGVPERPATFGLALLVLLGAWTVSAITSMDLSQSMNSLAPVLALGLLFFLAFLFSRSLRTLQLYLGWMLGAAALLALFGLYQYGGGLSETYARMFGLQPPQGFVEKELAARLLSGRAFSLFVYPNVFAGFLAMLIPIGLVQVLSATRPMARWGWGSLLVLLLVGLFSTQSLGGWIAAALGVGLFYSLLSETYSLHPKNRWAMGVWITGILLLLGGLWLVLNHRGMGAAWDGWAQRWEHWKVALRMLRAHPFLGIGPGMFGAEYSVYATVPGQYARFAHNAWLQVAAETGMLGLGALGWFLWSLFRMWQRGWGAWKHHPQRTWYVGLTAGLLAAVLHAAGDVDFHFLKNTSVVVLFLGMLMGLAGSVSKPRLEPAAETQLALEHPMGRWGWIFALGAILTLVLWRAGRSLPVEVFLYWSVGLLWLMWMVRSSQQGRLLFSAVPMRWLMGGLWIWGIVSAALSSHPAAAVPGLMLGLVAFLVFWLSWEWAPRSWSLIWVLIVTALGMSVMALVEVGWPGSTRATGHWPNPNLLGAYLAMGCLATAGMAAGWETTWGKKVGLGLAALVMVLGILATGSMGAWLNVLAGAVVLVFWSWRHHRRYALGAGAAVVIMIVLTLVLPLALRQRLVAWDAYAGPAYERWHMASAAIQMGADHPLAGVGPGNFAATFEQYSFPNVRGLARYGKVAQFAHNEWLQILAVLGIPGLVMLCVILGWSLHRFWSLWRMPFSPTKSGWSHAVPLAASLAVVGALVQGSVDFNWHPPALLLWSMALLGMTFAGLKPAVETAPILAQARPFWQRSLPLVLLLVGLTALLAASRPLLSEYYLAQGEAQRYKKNFKAAAQLYQRALLAFPLAATAYDRLGQTQLDFYATSGAEHWFALSEWAFQKALTLDGLDPYIHRHLAQLYGLKASQLSGNERQRYYVLAMDQYQAAVTKAPHQAFLSFELGNVCRDAGLNADAETHWRAAVELEPHYAAAWSNLGVIQEIRGNTVGAEASYQKALAVRALSAGALDKYEIELVSINPTVVHYNYGQLLERQARWREAKEQYAAVLQFEPNHSQAKRRWQALRRIVP